MKKKGLLALCLVLSALMLSGCVSMLTMRSMMKGENPLGGMTSASISEDGESVTISREEYERYRQFDELLSLMEAADTYYYQEPDHTKMLQGASAGLLAGLGDYYTFYYTPESWKQMWEDDEGEYAGVAS